MDKVDLWTSASCLNKYIDIAYINEINIFFELSTTTMIQKMEYWENIYELHDSDLIIVIALHYPLCELK